MNIRELITYPALQTSQDAEKPFISGLAVNIVALCVIKSQFQLLNVVVDIQKQP